MAGFTDNYLRVNITPDPALSNTVQPVRIVEMHPEGEESEGEVVR